ncbi:hypothetical protein D9M70_644880 [compost metagenome]
MPTTSQAAITSGKVPGAACHSSTRALPWSWPSACSAASCSSVMKYLSATGRTSALQIKPSTSKPARMYKVMSYTAARSTPSDSWYSRKYVINTGPSTPAAAQAVSRRP